MNLSGGGGDTTAKKGAAEKKPREVKRGDKEAHKAMAKKEG